MAPRTLAVAIGWHQHESKDELTGFGFLYGVSVVGGSLQVLGSRDVRCGTLTCNFRVLAVDIRCRSLTCGIAMHMTPPPMGRKGHTISGRLQNVNEWQHRGWIIQGLLRFVHSSSQRPAMCQRNAAATTGKTHRLPSSCSFELHCSSNARAVTMWRSMTAILEAELMAVTA